MGQTSGQCRDIALPCATQNELDKDAAHKLVRNGCSWYGAKIPHSDIKVFQDSQCCWTGQGCQCRRVACSALEMHRTACVMPDLESGCQIKSHHEKHLPKVSEAPKHIAIRQSGGGRQYCWLHQGS